MDQKSSPFTNNLKHFITDSPTSQYFYLGKSENAASHSPRKVNVDPNNVSSFYSFNPYFLQSPYLNIKPEEMEETDNSMFPYFDPGWAKLVKEVISPFPKNRLMIKQQLRMDHEPELIENTPLSQNYFPKAPILIKTSPFQATHVRSKTSIKMSLLRDKSISILGHKRNKLSEEYNSKTSDILDLSTEVPSKTFHRKNKKSTLAILYRRKSCACSLCGGVSKIEKTIQNLPGISHDVENKSKQCSLSEFDRPNVKSISRTFIETLSKMKDQNKHHGKKHPSYGNWNYIIEKISPHTAAKRFNHMPAHNSQAEKVESSEEKDVKILSRHKILNSQHSKKKLSDMGTTTNGASTSKKQFRIKKRDKTLKEGDNQSSNQAGRYSKSFSQVQKKPNQSISIVVKTDAGTESEEDRCNRINKIKKSNLEGSDNVKEIQPQLSKTNVKRIEQINKKITRIYGLNSPHADYMTVIKPPNSPDTKQAVFTKRVESLAREKACQSLSSRQFKIDIVGLSTKNHSKVQTTSPKIPSTDRMQSSRGGLRSGASYSNSYGIFSPRTIDFNSKDSEKNELLVKTYTHRSVKKTLNMRLYRY